LFRPIIVWSVNNDNILITFGIEFNNNVMCLAFDSKMKHFEPIETIPQLNLINICKQTFNYKTIDLNEELIF